MLPINQTAPSPFGPAADLPVRLSTRVERDSPATPVPYLAAGAILAPGEVYIDLANPCRGAFRALHGQMAGSRNRYVPRRAVTAALWQQLVERCARIGIALTEAPAALR